MIKLTALVALATAATFSTANVYACPAHDHGVKHKTKKKVSRSVQPMRTHYTADYQFTPTYDYYYQPAYTYTQPGLNLDLGLGSINIGPSYYTPTDGYVYW